MLWNNKSLRFPIAFFSLLLLGAFLVFACSGGGGGGGGGDTADEGDDGGGGEFAPPDNFLETVETAYFPNPADSRIYSATLEDGSTIVLFGTKDANGMPQTITHMIMVNSSGELSQLDFSDSGDLQRTVSSEGAISEFTYIDSDTLQVKVSTPKGYYWEQANLDWTDNPAAAASRILKGCDPPAIPSESMDVSDAPRETWVEITVYTHLDCQPDLPAADVDYILVCAFNKATGDSKILKATRTDTGTYTFKLPLDDWEISVDQTTEACEQTRNWVSNRNTFIAAALLVTATFCLKQKYANSFICAAGFAVLGATASLIADLDSRFQCDASKGGGLHDKYTLLYRVYNGGQKTQGSLGEFYVNNATPIVEHVTAPDGPAKQVLYDPSKNFRMDYFAPGSSTMQTVSWTFNCNRTAEGGGTFSGDTIYWELVEDTLVMKWVSGLGARVGTFKGERTSTDPITFSGEFGVTGVPDLGQFEIIEVK